MRFRLLIISLVAGFLPAQEVLAQGAPKARAWNECDAVCFSLTEAIRTRPETMEMRLEDALVIRQECAGEIVAAALNAVGPNRALRDKIVRVALKIAPEKSQSILYAARNPTRNVPVGAVDEEKLLAAAVVVKKAIIPEEEVRRAGVPATIAAGASTGPEVRRAIRLSEPPAIEVRRAEVASLELSQYQQR